MIKKEYPSNTPEMEKNSPCQLKDVYSQDKNHYASSPITDRILPSYVYIIEPPPYPASYPGQFALSELHDKIER